MYLLRYSISTINIISRYMINSSKNVQAIRQLFYRYETFFEHLYKNCGRFQEIF